MSSVLTRLMMFVNDTGIVNESLKDWSTTQDKERKGRKDGARTFLARLQMALVFEALEVIKDIRDNATWMKKVEQCDAKTQEHFAKASAYIDSEMDYKILAKLRNNSVFHYGNKLPVKAVEEMAIKNPKQTTTASMGDKILDWHFELGDLVAQRVVVHHVFQVEEDADLAKESDALAGRIFDIAEEVCSFAGGFIREHTKA